MRTSALTAALPAGVGEGRSDQPRRDAIADAALDLGARVGRVIPVISSTDAMGCRRNSAVVPEWPHGASREPDMRSGPWRAATNVAVLLGAEEGIFVLDAEARTPHPYFDFKRADAGREADERAKSIWKGWPGGLYARAGVELQLQLPPTLSVLQFTGGVHYFFRWPKQPVPACPGKRLPSSRVHLSTSSRVHLYSRGHWLICPPGTVQTVWMPRHGPGEVEIAEAPAWLLWLLRYAKAEGDRQ